MCVQRSILAWGPVPVQIVECLVAYLEDALLDDILLGPGSSAAKVSGEISPYKTPKLSSLIRLGTASTTSSFVVVSAAEMGGCIVARGYRTSNVKTARKYFVEHMSPSTSYLVREGNGSENESARIQRISLAEA